MKIVAVSLLLLVGVLASAQVQQEMLSAVNAERARNGRPPLCLNAKLNAAAQAHSNDMANNNFLGHTGSDGSSASNRISRSGFSWQSIAENVAAGQANVGEAMTSWINSPGHRTNLMGDYRFLGVGYARRGGTDFTHYWTQKFAQGAGEACTPGGTQFTHYWTQKFARGSSESCSSGGGGGGGSSVGRNNHLIQWRDGLPQGTRWASACDFTNRDIGNVQIRGEDCAATCQATSGCTHFAHSQYRGGTCWMKSGPVSLRNAFHNGDNSVVCGVVP